MESAIKAGLVDVLQHTLIDTLNYRFKSISDTLESLIFRIEDEVILKRLLYSSLSATSIEEFEAQLTKD